MPADTITVVDNRTGREYTMPIVDGAVPSMAFREIKVEPTDFGLMTYDPGYKNTASTRSTITYIDGSKGILRHRGYSIEDLSESCSFLEVAWLVLKGELPTASDLETFEHEVTHHTFLHEKIKRFMEGFRVDAHPMGMFIGTTAALSTFYPEHKQVLDPEFRWKAIVRLIAKVPTIAAFSYRHGMGQPVVYPNNEMSYVANFLTMMHKIGVTNYEPHPDIVRAMEVLFILHADHEQNCSTTTMRTVGSSHADPFTATAAAAAALYGPLHGGANEAVLRMLAEIGSTKNIPSYLESVRKGEQKLMGFGHRVYKAYDPRAKVIKGLAHKVFDVTGRNPMLDIALELERIALEDEYFAKRRLYPNVDFYSGIIYQALGLPPSIFTVLFAIPRTVGWLAQWQELLTDSAQKIARPRQLYVGEGSRAFVPVETRD